MPKLLTLFVLFSVFDSPRSLLAQYTHTYIEKGLAITTSGAMDVFNETYNTKMLALNELISPAIRDSKLIDTISKYKDNPTKQRAALDILSTLHADVFIEDKVEFQAGI
ncbi:MAG: hypothetical protein WCQ47_03540, partial [bacterium]